MLQQLEQPVVAKGCHLDRLAQARPSLALRQGPRRGGVDDDGCRLVKRADEVLALWQVHCRLAPDRGIDLGHEGRRDVDHRDPTQVGGRQESGCVAEGAAADGHDRFVAFHSKSSEPAPCRLQDAQALGGLTLRQQDRIHGPACCPQSPDHPFAEGAECSGLRHDDRPPGLQPSKRLIHAGDRPAIGDQDASDRGGRPEQRRRIAQRRVRGFGEAPFDHVDDLVDLLDTGHPQVGGGVEPLATRGEIAERADGITPGDQRAHVRGAAQALGEHLRATVQPDRHPTPVQQPAIARVHDRATTGRNDPAHLGGRVRRPKGRHRPTLQRPECGLAIRLKDGRDGPTVLVLDPLVEVDELRGVAVCQPPADDALAAPGQSDEDEIHDARA